MKQTKTKGKNNLQVFGANVRRLREARELSLRDLASQCEIDHSAIARIEKGEKNITLQTLIELSRGLYVQPKKLLDIEFRLDN